MAAQHDLFAAPADVPETPAPPSPAQPTGARKLTLIDASGLIFRAYHALPPLSTSKGVVTHAVLGFARMLLKLIREREPTHLALCFDVDSRKGRLAIDSQYKANRTAAPDDLKSQFELIYQVASVLRVATLESPGWEADDVIASMTKLAVSSGFDVDIVTSDKDFAQMLRPGVTIFDPMKDKPLTEADVVKKFGVPPSQMRDYQALVGDAIDNIPKVPGIGPKTAVELLSQFGSIAAMRTRLNDVSKPKIRQALEENSAQLDRALQLVSFKEDLVFDVTPQQLERQPFDLPAAQTLFSELEFFRLLTEIGAPAPQVVLSAPEEIRTPARLAEVMSHVEASAAFLVAMSGSPTGGQIECLVLAVGEKGYALSTTELGPELPRQLNARFATGTVELLTHDAKLLMHAFEGLGVEWGKGLRDTQLMSYLLNPSRKDGGLVQLLRERAGVELEGPKGTPVVTQLAALAVALPSLVSLLNEDVQRAQLAALTDDLEMPLTPILQRMEKRGILLDTTVLDALATEVDALSTDLLATVYRLAGREFNVGSPAQLAQVLFEELHLPVLKKGKTGPSTDHEVLEKLAEQHELPQAIIEYRNLSKLKSTYLDTLPHLAGADGRIRTTLQQAAVATGRLSSINPNLQNIPVRNALGKKIRGAFVAPKGSRLLSADYSQIELRILAHIAEDAALIEAFERGADVHVRTAAEVFRVPENEVTAEHRRAAKMVNYGIAYGLSAHGLATRLNIGNEQAKKIIDDYFAHFPGITRYIESTIEKGKSLGYVESLFGRRRMMPELNNKNRSIASAAERAAINMPIQGTAADIIKRAMLVVDRELKVASLQATMLLQVHDELLFEVPEAELEQVSALVRKAMSEAAVLKVPLQVDIGIGQSWAEAH